mgnify:CR=1 FL=1
MHIKNPFSPGSRKIKKTDYLWLLAFSTVFFVYVYIAWITQPGDHVRVIDFMDHFPAFNGDDSYRYFFYRQAFTNLDLYSWNYILPVPLVLDGMILALFGDDVFLARTSHAFFAFVSLYFLYRTQRVLGVGTNLAATSVIIIALMPVYALYSMSFYAESWFVFFITLVWLLFASKKYFSAALVASLLPLIRPDGFFFLVPIFLFFIYKGKFKEFLALGFLGSVYFVWLVFSLGAENFGDYFLWRKTYREYVNHIRIPEVEYWYGFFVTFNFFWYFPVFIEAVKTKWKSPVFILAISTIFVVAILLLTSFLGFGYYEPRYFIVFFPMGAVFFSLFFTRVLDGRNGFSLRHKVAGVVVVFIMANHFLQNDEIRNRFFDGVRLPFYKKSGITHGLVNDKKEVRSRKEIISVVYSAIAEYPQIDALFVPGYRDIYYL